MALLYEPVPIFHERDGSPLENGQIYIGTANLDARTNPIQVYWDEALSITATQPIRTVGGYPAYQGKASQLYGVPSTYSFTSLDKNGAVIHEFLKASSIVAKNTALVAEIEADANAAVSAALAATTGDLNTALEAMNAILQSCGCNAPIVRVQEDGWQALVTNPTDLPLTDLVVVRRGYDTTATANWHADTVKLTKRVRQVYPNQATFTTDKQALSDYVYSTDEIYGANNASTETSPKPIANWVMPDRDRITNGNCSWEIVAFHRDARPDSAGVGRQVACVKVRANDGTTQTAWQTVAVTAQSTYCEDANAPEVYKGTLDVSGLADGAFWLEAEVYPWFGNAASVLKSEDGTTARGFSRRWFRKGGTTQYVAVSSGGNDSTGVVNATEATAIATPCLTVAGALKKAHDVLGTSNGALDVVQIVIVNSVSLGTVTFTGSYKQDISAVKITRATGTTRANAIVTTSANWFPDFDTHTIARNEGALWFEDMTLTFGGIHTIQGATGVPLSIIFKNCNVNMGGFATPIRASSLSHLSFYGCVFSNMPASSNNALGYTTVGEVRILRGCTVNMNDQAMDGFLAVGNDITASKGQGYLDSTKPAIYYNNRYLSPNATISAILVDAQGTATTAMGPVAVVQNLVEWTSATSNPAIRISGDGDEGSISHAVVHHNVCPGSGVYGRWNIFYDEDATVLRTHKLISFKGNLGAQLNTKGDIFKTDGARIGQFPFTHGVGCEGTYSIDAANAPSSEHQSYPGLGSKIANGDPLFTDNQATTAGPSAGAGGGDYTLQVSSPARDILSKPVLAFDLAGASRGTGTQDAGAYA